MNRTVLAGSSQVHSDSTGEGRALVRSLDDQIGVDQVGGKARNLARVIALGMPVPTGRVLTCEAFDLFLTLDGLRNRVEPIGIHLDSATPDRLRNVSETIHALVASEPIPRSVQKAIELIARDLPLQTGLAVRSSAVGEDSAHASFAGQFDSILGVTTPGELERAVRTCWASYWSERALFYRRARRAQVDSMAVIIQQQVSATTSGVLFTRAPGGTPESGPDDLVIEYCAGLGDRLVSGRINPARLIVSRANLSVRKVMNPAADAGSLTVSETFTPRRILDLVRLALQLEREFGGPQDIEWAIDADGRLWILQARPITPPSVAAGHTRETMIWSNANVNENFPQPISPLLYSIASAGYYHYFKNLGLAFGISRRRLAAMDRALGAIIGVHGGRMYYNLTSIHAVLRMAPFGERLTRAFNEFVGADEIAGQPADATSWNHDRSRVASTLELLRIAAQTTWQYLFLGRRLRAFEQTADAFATRTHPERLRRRSLTELIGDLQAFLDIRFRRWKNASLTDAGAMVCYALLQRALAGTGDDLKLHNRLLRALPDVPSTTPPLRLWELSRMIRSEQPLRDLFAGTDASEVLDAIRRDARFVAFRDAFDRYLEDWGFRSSGELMLTVPSLQEDPIPAIELLKRYAASDGESPETTISRQAAERLDETSRVLRRLARRSPLRAATVWLLLRWTQKTVAYRERARLKQALLYTRCRRLALAIGDRLTDTGFLRAHDDVFMLTWQEMVELGSGRAMFPYRISELVSLRRREYAALAAMQPPDDIRLPEGAYLPLASPATDTPPRVGGHALVSSTLHGTSACGGVVTGRAAVLADVRDAGTLQRGDVLVTRQTDPGWASVFGLISGLVIERGGMLSHGAIVAREFGLPCIVGVRDATQRIAHGVTVTVDGDRGTCIIDAERAAHCSAERDAQRVVS